MKVAGSAVLHAEPTKVWAAINDPKVLAAVIPGCERLDQVGPSHYRGVVSMGIATIKGTYEGEIKLDDLKEPNSLTLKADGAGGAGTISTTVAVTLTDRGDGTTEVAYDADAVVGGMVGGVGQRVLASVAKKTAGAFFNQIDAVLTGAKTIDESALASPDVPGESGAAPPAGIGPRHSAAAVPGALAAGSQGFIVGALVGALAMLIGVLVGGRIARK